MRFFVVMLLLFAAVGVGGYFYSTHEMSVHGFDKESICGHRIMNRYNEYLRWIAVPIPARGPDAESKNKEEMQKYQEILVKASMANRDDFTDVLKVASAAKRMKIVNVNILCFPVDVISKQTELFQEYSNDVDARIKKDENTCKLNYEDDVIDFLTHAFPCAPTGG